MAAVIIIIAIILFFVLIVAAAFWWWPGDYYCGTSTPCYGWTYPGYCSQRGYPYRCGVPACTTPVGAPSTRIIQYNYQDADGDADDDVVFP